MSSTQAITQRLNGLIHHSWISGTDFHQLLDDLTIEEATTSIHGRNTIALLTYHLRYYVDGVLDVLRGHPLTISDAKSFDMPAMESGDDWVDLREGFIHSIEDFIQAVEEMPDGWLSAPFVRPEYGDYLRNMDGLLSHTYYHMGQISLIKKMLRSA